MTKQSCDYSFSHNFDNIPILYVNLQVSQTSSSFTHGTDQSGSFKSIQSSKTNVSNAVGQIFTMAARYKGSIVAVRKVRKDSIKITRKIQLEMSKVGPSYMF